MANLEIYKNVDVQKNIEEGLVLDKVFILLGNLIISKIWENIKKIF